MRASCPSQPKQVYKTSEAVLEDCWDMAGPSFASFDSGVRVVAGPDGCPRGITASGETGCTNCLESIRCALPLEEVPMASIAVLSRCHRKLPASVFDVILLCAPATCTTCNTSAVAKESSKLITSRSSDTEALHFEFGDRQPFIVSFGLTFPR
ncbi:hypothetical protein Nepgr_016630 [Nepenthes gracilis]|uniref:Uncharacterized protein n=1 Tax=Nepenthes gracilis TaxID=150966 RepID=A0AAD3XSA7_NEPGR|nr:hypothetical protein Nepgr_016630 [Nepenthes gracilis]